MHVATLIFVAAFVAQCAYVDAQIPIPCATVESLRARRCCPTPNSTLFPNAGRCGANLTIPRGSCQPIAISDSKFNAEETDERMNWPIQYFNSTCVCEKNFGGFDCGECDYAYNDGTTECSQKTVRARNSIADLKDVDWQKLTNALMNAKTRLSRYMVVINYTTDPEVLVSPTHMVRPTHYDLFIWFHHFVAKDNDLTIKTDNFLDFAHESTGFPTWHRQMLLWFEREIQMEEGDPMFRLHYWDWRDPEQRDILFKRDRLGENVNGNVVGDLFNNWDTYCWQDISGKQPPIATCDPTQPTNETLRRCPSKTLCDKSNKNWPSYLDVDTAISIKSYDTSPYDRFIQNTEKSYRNYMEGFITQRGTDCGGDTLCTTDGNVTVKRRIHNTVHILLGIGDFVSGPSLSFSETGVMADVAASPNDPSFINHHTMIDCILEEWIQRNKDDLTYPTSNEIREGHRDEDYIVPLIPLSMQKDMFKTADNFGYSCSLPKVTDVSGASVSLHAYVMLMIGSLAAAIIVK